MLKKLLKQTFHMTQKSQIKQPSSPFLQRAVTGTKSLLNMLKMFIFYSIEHDIIHIEKYILKNVFVQWKSMGPKQHWKQSHKDLEQHELLKTELTFWVNYPFKLMLNTALKPRSLQTHVKVLYAWTREKHERPQEFCFRASGAARAFYIHTVL